MKLPFYVLSYGEFSKTKKLFVYENNGIPIMPIFYNATKAFEFQKYMELKLRELGDYRDLSIQVCTNRNHACDMLELISAISPELQTIAINPTIENGAIIENLMIGFDIAIERLQGGGSTESDNSKA